MIRIDGGFFCAGIEHKDGVVVRTAPILKYMLGWNGRQVADYCRKRGWIWERL